MTSTSIAETGPTGRPAESPRQTAALAVIATAQLMVVLDATVVTVALPHIQSDLHFSGSGLEWVVNAYALTLGGLLLLGGRAGDLFGRRRVFMAGLLLFVAASFAGGFASTASAILIARAVQGVGGALVAPTALALIATTFPEGRPRSRAMGVYSAMSAIGTVVGLIAGGLLVTYLSWRWVFFVNVPIGLAIAIAAPFVLRAGGRPAARRRLDLPGAVTGTIGVTALVYGLSNAATSPDGVSHWGDAKVVFSLIVGAVLLATFWLIESRGDNPLLPVHLLKDRERAGANLIMLVMSTAAFGMFFFVSLFVQNVWGYSPLKTGVSFLPLALAMLLGSTAAANLVPRIGARPLILTGGIAAVGGSFWLSRVTEHGTYTSGLLQASLLFGAGFGLMIVPLTLTGLVRVAETESGAAASLLNVGRQVGGSIGLAILGTVAWTVVARETKKHAVAALPANAREAAYRHALAVGFDHAFLVSSGICVLIVIIALILISPAHRQPSTTLAKQSQLSGNSPHGR